MLTFATEPVPLTGFQTSTTDADSALRSISTNPVQGTTLYDALVVSAHSLASEAYLGRVIIIVTDGNETLSEATADDAIAAAQRRRAVRLRRRDREQPLQSGAPPADRREDGRQLLRRRRLGRARRGLQLDRRGALPHVASRVRHVGAAERGDRPHRHLGWRIRLRRRRGPGDAVSPTAPARRPAPGAVLRDVLGPGCVRDRRRAHRAPRGRVRLRLAEGRVAEGRLEPHVAAKRRREAVGAARSAEDRRRPLPRDRERPGQAQAVAQAPARARAADLPLRTVEFVYLMLGARLLGGLVAAG